MQMLLYASQATEFAYFFPILLCQNTNINK